MLAQRGTCSTAAQPQRGAEEMIAWYQDLVGKYPIVSIEDGLDESD